MNQTTTTAGQILGDDDLAGDGDLLCRNTCNATFTVRICNDPGISCFGWQPLQVFSIFMFFLMTVIGVVFGLGVQTTGCAKACQWGCVIVGLVCFSVVVSSTTTSTRAAYDHHMAVQFGIGMAISVGWMMWAAYRQWQRRRRAAWVRANYQPAPDGHL